MTQEESTKLEGYLRKTFRLDTIEVRRLPKEDAPAEVYIGEEFIGTLSEDPDDPGDYHFQMAILGFDLDEA